METNRSWTIVTLFFAMAMSAQTTDLARVEYKHQSFSKSENSLNRYRALVQVPIPLNSENDRLFVIGLEYRYVDINIRDSEDVAAFNNHVISSVQQMDSYLGYVWKSDDDWLFGVKAGVKIESDFDGSLVHDDFIYHLGAYVIKDKKKNPGEGEKPYRFIAGLTYSTVPGRWYPLPLLNYYKEFRPNWTYTLGVPKTNIRYYFSSKRKDAVQAFATLDHVFANIHQNFKPTSPSVPQGKIAESIQQTIVLLGVGYEHFFTEHFLFYAYASHSVYNDFRLESGDGEEVYVINNENSPDLRVGLKFKY